MLYARNFNFILLGVGLHVISIFLFYVVLTGSKSVGDIIPPLIPTLVLFAFSIVLLRQNYGKFCMVCSNESAVVITFYRPRNDRIILKGSDYRVATNSFVSKYKVMSNILFVQDDRVDTVSFYSKNIRNLVDTLEKTGLEVNKQ